MNKKIVFHEIYCLETRLKLNDLSGNIFEILQCLKKIYDILHTIPTSCVFIELIFVIEKNTKNIHFKNKYKSKE